MSRGLNRTSFIAPLAGQGWLPGLEPPPQGSSPGEEGNTIDLNRPALDEDDCNRSTDTHNEQGREIMTEEHRGELTIGMVPSGSKGKAILTAKLGSDVLAVDTVDLTRSNARTAFVLTVCAGHPGIDAEAVESELLVIAADIASDRDNSLRGMVADCPEVDVAHIIRPERFIAPELSGLAVPTTILVADRPVRRYQLHMQWADGRRESRTLPPHIELPGDRKLWIHPESAEPASAMQPGWSRQGRTAWLAGDQAPDPAEVFRRICDQIARFLDLPAEQAPGITATLALWTMLTYCFPAWNAVPYLYVGGPTGSGKTRVFEILKQLVFRSFHSSNMTAASLFRTLHAQGGTLLLDEAERLKQTHSPEVQELLSMLLAGYKRGGQATRLEAVGDSFKTMAFDVFGPKAIACISGLPPSLASRCIPIVMFRAAPGSEKFRRSVDADSEGWRQLRDDLHALALEHGAIWLELAQRTDVCPRMSGRDYELWQPLLALAWWLETYGMHGLLELVQDHSSVVINGGRDDSVPDADDTLLHLLADAFRSGAHPTPHELLKKAQEQEPEVFRCWYPRGVTARLKSYGVPVPYKSGSRREFRGVTADLLLRIQTNYSIDLGIPPETACAAVSSEPFQDQDFLPGF